MFFLWVLIFLCLVLIGYQDLRYRAVYWFCFPVLAGGLFIIKGMLMGFHESITDTAYALVFLLAQLVLLWGYFSLKNRRMINLTKEHLGLGDILFLIAVAFYLSPGNYVLFYVMSLFLVLIYAICSSFFKVSSKAETIPLAGLQAILFAVLILAGKFLPFMSLRDDQWIYTLISS